MTMRYMKVRPNAYPPERKTPGAAGFDLRACIDEPWVFEPHQVRKVPTGLAFEIPEMWMGLILIRSSWGECMDTIHPPIDSDYRGEVSIMLHNFTSCEQLLRPQTRIAQLVIVTALTPPMDEVQELSKTSRGAKGFGSTGQT
jgi:dUTP pyrophosphatase